MPPHNYRRPDVASRDGGKDYDSIKSANVVKFPAQIKNASSFDELTAEIIFAKFRAGTLPEAVLIAFTQAAGVPL
jgi:hypothetical protein